MKRYRGLEHVVYSVLLCCGVWGGPSFAVSWQVPHAARLSLTYCSHVTSISQISFGLLPVEFQQLWLQPRVRAQLTPEFHHLICLLEQQQVLQPQLQQALQFELVMQNIFLRRALENLNPEGLLPVHRNALLLPEHFSSKPSVLLGQLQVALPRIWQDAWVAVLPMEPPQDESRQLWLQALKAADPQIHVYQLSGDDLAAARFSGLDLLWPKSTQATQHLQMDYSLYNLLLATWYFLQIDMERQPEGLTPSGPYQVTSDMHDFACDILHAQRGFVERWERWQREMILQKQVGSEQLLLALASWCHRPEQASSVRPDVVQQQLRSFLFSAIPQSQELVESQSLLVQGGKQSDLFRLSTWLYFLLLERHTLRAVLYDELTQRMTAHRQQGQIPGKMVLLVPSREQAVSLAQLVTFGFQVKALPRHRAMGW